MLARIETGLHERGRHLVPGGQAVVVEPVAELVLPVGAFQRAELRRLCHQVDGLLSGEFQINGEYLRPHGTGKMEIMDGAAYGGSGIGNYGGADATPLPYEDLSHSLNLTLPPLGALFLTPG